MKTGRNKPCPCGSGKKYKRCHGYFGPALVEDPAMIQFLHSSRNRHEAKEHIRQTQQGRGKPIISAKTDTHQIVAVGKNLMFSSTWKTFTDFLGDYLKTKLDPNWGNSEIAKPLNQRHTILQWYDVICRLQKASIKKPGVPAQIDITGVLACYYGLAYSLYLIEHNVELQSRMITRLKDRSNFQGAYYELMVARALIAAGFELTLEDEVDRTAQHCEFAAVSKDTKQKYWIEAKMRSVPGLMGKNETDGTSEKNAPNPTSHLVRHLHAALRKPADDQRMIFIDLNTEMSADISDSQRPNFVESVNRKIAKYEKEQLEEGKSAYVFITNMTFHRDLLGPPQMISIPTSVGIPDFNRAGQYKLSNIYRRDQKHSDAIAVGESIEKLLGIPNTFDGSLPGTSLNGEKSPVQIGEKYIFGGAGANGSDLIGEVTEAIVDETAKESIIAIYTDNDEAHILKEAMTEGQMADYKAHKQAYFGRVKYTPEEIKSPYDLFLFFVHSQKGMNRDSLLEQLKMTRELAQEISDEDLLLEYCERLVSGSGMFKVIDGVITTEPADRVPSRSGSLLS